MQGLACITRKLVLPCHWAMTACTREPLSHAGSACLLCADTVTATGHWREHALLQDTKGHLQWSRHPVPAVDRAVVVQARMYRRTAVDRAPFMAPMPGALNSKQTLSSGYNTRVATRCRAAAQVEWHRCSE